MKKTLTEKLLAVILAICIIGAVAVPMMAVSALAEDKALELDFSGCTTSDGNVKLTANKTCRGTVAIQFEYYIPSATAPTTVRRVQDGEVFGTLEVGFGAKFSKTVESDGYFRLGIWQDATAGKVGKVYIWNLSVIYTPTDGGAASDLTAANPAVASGAAKKIIDKKDMPKAPVPLNRQDKNIEAFHLTGNQIGAKFYDRYMDMSGGKHTYTIAFDYYLVGGAVQVADIENSVVLKDATTGKSDLQEGVHTFSATYTANGKYTVRLAVQQTAAGDVDLYIANFTLLRDDADVATGEIVTGFSSKKMTVGDIPFAGAVTALKIDCSEADSVVVFYGDSAIRDTDKVEFTFTYWLKEKEDKAAVVTVDGSDKVTELAALTADGDKHTFRQTFNGSQLSSDCRSVGVKLAANTVGEIYLWNLSVKVNGKWVIPAEFDAVAAQSDLISTIDYEQIPFPEPVYKFVTGTPYDSLYDQYNTSVSRETSYRVSFDYYMPTEGEVQVGVYDSQEKVGDKWKPVKDDAGVSLLKPGGYYSFVGNYTTASGLVQFSIQTRDDTPCELYVSKFRIYRDGQPNNIATGVIKCNSGTVTTQYQFPEIPPEQEKEHAYKMLKQDNSVTIEGYDDPLAYQQFYLYLGANRGTDPIKPNATYIFSFDYFCVVEDGEDAVYGPLILTRIPWGTSYVDPSVPGDVPENHNGERLYRDKKGSITDAALDMSPGHHQANVEFKALDGLDELQIGVQSGNYDGSGDVYYWNFKLVEKNNPDVNLLTRGDLDGEWGTLTTNSMKSSNGRWGVSETNQVKVGEETKQYPGSKDQKGTYALVDFIQSYADTPVTDNTQKPSGGGEGEGTGGDTEEGGDEGEDEEIDLSKEEADFGDDIEDGPEWIPTGGTTIINGGVDTVTKTVYRTRKKTAIFENSMDKVWFITAIVEGVLLLACIALGVVLLIVRKRKRLQV